MGWHDALKSLAVACGRAKPDGISISIHPVDLKEKGRADQPNPDFRGVDAVPMRAFACREKKQKSNLQPLCRRLRVYPATTLGNDRLQDEAEG